MSTFNGQIPKWFGQLTILSQVEGHISKFKCSKPPLTLSLRLPQDSNLSPSPQRGEGIWNFFFVSLVVDFLNWNFRLDHQPVNLLFSELLCLGNLIIFKKDCIALTDEAGLHHRIVQGKGVLLAFFCAGKYTNHAFLLRLITGG